VVLDTVGWCKLKSKLQALGVHRGQVFDGRIRGELSSVDGGRAADYCAADGGRAAARELHFVIAFIFMWFMSCFFLVFVTWLYV